MMSPKDKLYSLIDDFINNRIYLEQFCTMFPDTYNLEINQQNDLSIEENRLFGELSRIAYGYTEDEEEIRKLPQYYFSGEQVVAKVDEVRQILQ